jgi:hypothetical protein
MTRTRKWGWRRRLLVASIGAPALALGFVPSAASAGSHNVRATTTLGPDGLGIRPGLIKHVWLIILENKSYDATFTGLNDNTYVWQTHFS